jgi:hypothetical protein
MVSATGTHGFLNAAATRSRTWDTVSTLAWGMPLGGGGLPFSHHSPCVPNTVEVTQGLVAKRPPCSQ